MFAPNKEPNLRNPLSTILSPLSSIWFGIILATLLFFYCSIGSAVPAVRQHPMLEMTEFEWFHWWPFNVLVLLYGLNMTVVTIRRIPLRTANLGVWMIHAGIVILVVGSYYYFSTKVEGDTPVFRRRVAIAMPGMQHPASLVALPGNEKRVQVGSDTWQFQIQSTNHSWPILSEEHEGETAYSVNVSVTPPTGSPFIRQLLSDYPQYTEDIIPGKGRAIKSLGRKLVEEALVLTLEYEPQEYFHVMNTWALFVRPLGETEWKERPIEGLPRYHDRIGSRDHVFSEPHDPITLRSIDLDVPPGLESDALQGQAVRISGYLRYAHMDRKWREGEGRHNPVLQLSFFSDQSPDQNYELSALDRTRSVSEDGLVQFVWLDDKTAIDRLPKDARPRLRIEVPGADVSFDVAITNEVVVGNDGPFTSIDKTDFSYRIRNIQDGLSLPGGAGAVSIAMVDIKTPDGELRRWVADDPRFTRDIQGGTGAGPHDSDVKEPDGRIVMTYAAQSAPILFAAYPGGLHYVFNGPEGEHVSKSVEIGEVVEVVPGLHVKAASVLTHAVSEIKPYVVPQSKRQRNARETFAMIRLEIDRGSGVQAKWVQFNQYALPGKEYVSQGRFAYSPAIFRGADGTPVEVMFSRQRRKLPAPIVLESFQLESHVGGYTGSMSTINNYFSQLRFQTGEHWTDPTTIFVNSPAEHGGFWYFQSSWDKPQSQDPTSGMNYTGLGVGNRNGVYTQLAGCCLAVVGMMYAFYVKPVLKRRRHLQSRARVSSSAEEPVSIDDVDDQKTQVEASVEV